MSAAGGASSLTAALQRTIETIYDVSAPVRVDDYLVTDPAVVGSLDRHGRPNVEKLLIRDDGDALSLSLYVAADSLARLHRRNPFARLDDGNLNDFCTVLEGVSHFTYVACNAAADKKVTLLELELQAEVDKFVVANALLGRQCASPQVQALWYRLFKRVHFAAALSPNELDRYRVANDAARRFCRLLQPRAGGRPRVVSALRRFYRMPKLAKLAAC